MPEPLMATLPMYDWAAVRPATDRLWEALKHALRHEGFDAPEALNRQDPPEELWLSPRLLLGQTCGLPYVSTLRDRVRLIGTPDYGVPDCPPGWYRSAIVVRDDDRRNDLKAFRGSALAINSQDSQSGALAMMHAVAGISDQRVFFDGVKESRSHANSIRAVSNGTADIAAIDSVTWRLAREHQAEAKDLRVLIWTAPAPGLPFIAALGFDAERIARAAANGIAALDEQTSSILGLRGFVRSHPRDYDIIQERVETAETIMLAHGLASFGEGRLIDSP